MSQPTLGLIRLSHPLHSLLAISNQEEEDERRRCADIASGPKIPKQSGTVSLNGLSTIVWPHIIHAGAVINNEHCCSTEETCGVAQHSSALHHSFFSLQTVSLCSVQHVVAVAAAACHRSALPIGIGI